MTAKKPGSKSSVYNPQHEQEQPPLVDLALYDIPASRRKSPKWVMEEQIIYGGNNETLFFIKRAGGHYVTVDLDKTFPFLHSEEFVKGLKDFGFNIVLASFEKNHAIEEEFVPARKKLAKMVHKYGMRLAVYIRADQVYHDFNPAGIAGKGFYQRDGTGRIPVYGDIFGYRKFVCMHNPGVMANYKETIRRAVCEVGVDALHFDGNEFGGIETMGACRCDKCRADFTDFLKRRYGRDLKRAKERFGHTNLENIEPPGMGTFPAIPTGPIVAPDWQEWISFRCTWSAIFQQEISEYIYSLNPEVAIIPNGSWPAVKENIALLMGWDAKTYHQHVDLVFSEDAYYPHVTADGKIIHKARQMKMARNEGFHLISYCARGGSERDLRIQLSFEAAFNRGRIPCIAWRPDEFSKALPPDALVKKKFVKWVNNHWSLYKDLETHAEFTVWRSQMGLAFSEHLAYAAYVQMEQLLTEERLPFEICFDECLDALDSRKVLIVPDVNCVTVGQADKIIKFVRNGGGLLTGRNTSLYDGWHRRRYEPLLKVLMQGSVENTAKAAMKHIAHGGAPVEFESAPGFGKEIQYFRSGKGRVVYFPSFVDPATQPPLLTPHGEINFSLDLTNWRRPENAGEIMSALRWLGGNRCRVRIDAPRGVLAEYYRQESKNRLMAHMVNLDATKPARNVAFRINTNPGETIESVELFSPDGPAPYPYEFVQDALGGTMTMDQIITYAIAIVTFG